MTDTSTPTVPQTPADAAGAALDAIEAHPNAFSMSTWCWLPDGIPLSPHDDPPPGSILCAAAWVAHLTGWTLIDSNNLVQVTSRLTSEVLYEGYAYCYALKNGERRDIASVADDALGLKHGHRLWIGDADAALACLRQTAGR